MFEAYKKDVEFFGVDIREAHAIDSRLPMEFGMIEDPVTELERLTVASECMADLELPFPAIVDKMDDAVNLAYHGWPDRLAGRESRTSSPPATVPPSAPGRPRPRCVPRDAARRPPWRPRGTDVPGDGSPWARLPDCRWPGSCRRAPRR